MTSILILRTKKSIKKKALVKYFNKEWKLMKLHLQSFLKKEEQEDLHHFRIQVKRIIAFLILLDQLHHHTKLTKCFKPVKKLFKQAGVLRNKYISHRLIKEQFSANKPFKKFKSLAKKKRKNVKKTHLELMRKIGCVNAAAIRCFYQDQLQGIASSFNRVTSDDQLHELRKQIKGILYNYKPFCDVLIRSLNTGYLEQVEETIGKWHDQLLVATPDGKNAHINSRSEETELEKLRSHIKVLTSDFYQRALGSG